MTIVTTTEFEKNMKKYLAMAGEEEIVISKNGILVAKLVPYREYETDSLIGILDAKALQKDFDGDYRKLIQEMREKDYSTLR